MISINNLYVSYETTDAVSNVSFSAENQFLAIIGPNGSGKSSILKAIMNTVQSRGTVLIDESNISKMSAKELSKRIALFSQTNQSYFPYTVYETVLQGRYPYTNKWKGYQKEDIEITLSVLDELSLVELKDRLITQLSGGELQRVFLARVLVQEPDILLLDEPTNHLDLTYQVEILSYIKKWQMKHKKTVIAVLHDLNMVQNYADDVLLLQEGESVLLGHKSSVLHSREVAYVYNFNVRDWNIDVLRKWLA